MTKRRPILVGLHNPYSDDPMHALAPYPTRSSGYRLWSMLDDVAPKYSPHYRRIFSRFNLARTESDLTDLGLTLRAEILLIRDIHPGDTVVLLGDQVRRAFERATQRTIQSMLIHPQDVKGIVFRVIPHPSGRSTIYNHESNRTLVGLMLKDLCDEWASTARGGLSD